MTRSNNKNNPGEDNSKSVIGNLNKLEKRNQNLQNALDKIISQIKRNTKTPG